MPAPRATIHHNSQRKSREHNAPGPSAYVIATKRGANMKGPQPHAVAPAHARQPLGKADVLGEVVEWQVADLHGM